MEREGGVPLGSQQQEMDGCPQKPPHKLSSTAGLLRRKLLHSIHPSLPLSSGRKPASAARFLYFSLTSRLTRLKHKIQIQIKLQFIDLLHICHNCTSTKIQVFLQLIFISLIVSFPGICLGLFFRNLCFYLQSESVQLLPEQQEHLRQKMRPERRINAGVYHLNQARRNMWMKVIFSSESRL